MPTILKIGFTTYLVKNETAAVRALQALAGAVTVETHYHDGRHYYYPSEREREFSMSTISTTQLLPRKPEGDETPQELHQVYRQPAPRPKKRIGSGLKQLPFIVPDSHNGGSNP